MTELDRDRIVRLLQRLGEPDDARVSAAAKELSDLVKDAGVDWNDLLILNPSRADAAVEVSAGVENTDALPLIERLLARPGVSETTRDELSGYQEDIAAGEFTDDDLRYLQALDARL